MNEIRLWVCGLARGGTSAVAGIIHLLGIPFIYTSPLIVEYYEFSKLVVGNKLTEAQKLFNNIIQHYGSNFGLKVPAPPPSFVKPKNVVAVFRDPVAIAESIIRHDPYFKNKNMRDVLCGHVLIKLTELINYVKQNDVLIVSYEKLMLDSRSVINYLCEALDLSPTRKQINAAIKWCKKKGYKNIKDYKKLTSAK